MNVQPSTFAEYMATCSSDKSAVVAHYAEQERQAAEEAQQAKDAARYRWLRDTGGDGRPMVLIESRWYGNQHRACLDLDAAIDAAMAKEQ